MSEEVTGNVDRIRRDVIHFPNSVSIKEEEWGDGVVLRVPNWLGDAVMALPAMTRLGSIIPEGKGLFVVCPETLDDFFSTLRPSLVDEVVPVNAHQFWEAGARDRIRDLNAGVGVLFSNSLRDTLQLRWLGVSRLYGAAARARGVLMTRTFPFPRRKNGELNEFHHASRYLSIVEALGAPEWSGELPDFELPPLPTEIDPKIKWKGSAYACVAPGAAYGPAKRWPPANVVDVCSWLIKKGVSVVTVGTSAEKKIADQVRDSMPRESTLNLAGRTSLPQLMALIKDSKICLANDSGVMHLGAALGVPGVAVFGSTDPTATGPISDCWTVEYDRQPCSPCFRRECPQNTYACLNAISPQKVIASIEKLI